jgi:uncharacterized membrane protein
MAELESSVLSKVPAYEYLKQAGASVMGLGEMADHPVVLAQLGGAWRIGVQTDVVGGGLVAVFVPNSPNPMSGSVFLVAADSVRPASAPPAAAIGCLRRCGAGSEALLAVQILRLVPADRADHTAGIDPKHAFKIGPMNGRKRRESRRTRYRQDAP